MPSMKGKKPTITIGEDFEKQIKRMEEMAQLLETSPATSPSAHIAALWYFRDISSRMNLEQCRMVLGETSNEFIVCAMVENAVSIILRGWKDLDPLVKREYFDYFFGNALLKHRNSVKIRNGMLGACAKLLKRSVFDGHACDFDTLASKFYVLLTDDEPEFHRITYEFFLKILEEFDKYWRFADLGISYDFQYKAKLSFENDGLLQIFCKCIHVVPRFCVLVNNFGPPSNITMAEYFLRISSYIFARNFGIHHFSKKSSAAIKGPPKTWRMIFLWNEFLQLFFSLHRFLRNDRSLSVLTSSCIAQLTSISYVVLPDSLPNPNSEIIPFADIPHTSAYDKYTSNLLALFIWTFNNEAETTELYSYCLMIVNILNNHSIHSLARAEASFSTFISLIPILMEIFAIKLLYMNQKCDDEDDSENCKEKENEAIKECDTAFKWAYISAIQHLYKGWMIVLENSQIVEELISYAIDIPKTTIVLISLFMQTVFSIPFGDREEVSVPLPDREIFKEILIKIGTFSSYFLDQMLQKSFTILAETVEEFLATLETEMSMEELDMWRENMHWILLIVGHILVEEDKDHNCIWQSKLLVYYEDIITEEENNIDSYASYIEACINAPQTLTDPPDIDLVIKIIGTVFAWCSIEDELLKDHGITAISVELCSTSLWCAKRLISALGLHIQKSNKKNQLAKVSKDFSQILVDFALQKAFRIFESMPDERRVCMDAIELLAVLAHAMCRETSKCIFLFSYLSAVQINELIVRTSLVKVLVQIGSIIDDEAKQKTLYEMILVPIRTKFVSMCENSAETDENLDDLLDCFCAVVDAAQKCSANFLLAYLEPVLKCSVNLLSVYKDSGTIVNAVLQFFDCLTKRMYIYCDNHNDMLLLYEVLLDVVQTYEKEQVERYKKADSKEREKASDLILLLEILTNALNRRNRPVNLLTGKPEFTENRSLIVIRAWNMLLSVMRYDFLKLPLLRKNFYRFLKYSTEIAPECIAKLSRDNFILIVDYLRRGLQSDNEKDDLLCNLKDRFEQEVSMNSAYAIANLGIYFTKNTRNEMAIKTFSTLIAPTFAICLNALWQEDAESSATSAALYSLLCCNEDECKTYVKDLLSQEANHANRTALRTAFRTLMSHSPGKRFEKSKTRDFHDRLKQFLTKTEGLLVVE